MQKKKILFILALLLTAVTGAWADEWDVVYKQTQTKQSDWTALRRSLPSPVRAIYGFFWYKPREVGLFFLSPS